MQRHRQVERDLARARAGQPDASRARSRCSIAARVVQQRLRDAELAHDGDPTAGSGGSSSARRRYSAAASNALRAIACVAAARSASTHQSFARGRVSSRCAAARSGGARPSSSSRAASRWRSSRSTLVSCSAMTRRTIGCTKRTGSSSRRIAARTSRPGDDPGSPRLHARHGGRVPERAALGQHAHRARQLRARPRPPRPRARARARTARSRRPLHARDARRRAARRHPRSAPEPAHAGRADCHR